MANRSFRWPVRRNSGFSATPRSNWKKKPPEPTRSFAKKIVRKAGPQEKGAYWDSSFTTDGTEYGLTFAPSATYYPADNPHTVLTYGQVDAGPAVEKVYNRHIRVNVHLKAVQNAGSFATMRAMYAYLVKGKEDDITSAMTNLNFNEFGRQQEILGFQDQRSNGVVILGRKTFTMWHPPLQTDSNFERYAVSSERHYADLVFKSRLKFTLRSDEIIRLITGTRFANNVGGEAAANQSPVNGHWNLYWNFATY